MNALPAAVALRRPSVTAALRGLWARPDFLRLWVAQSVSLVGSEITVIALPLTAVMLLGASPAQMGFLAAAGKLPFVLVGLLAGVWVDRVRCRSVLVASDFGRAALLGVVPLAAALGLLNIELLIAVAFLAGVLSVFFDVAYQSYLPELIDRPHLADANSKLESSKSIADMAGPMLGSMLLQLMIAPFAIALDALSFVASAVLVRSIPGGTDPIRSAQRGSLLSEVGDGIRLVIRHPLLRAIAACSATMNLFYQMLLAVFILYVTTELELPPALVGVVLGVGSLAGVFGALLASRLANWLGTGLTLIGATVLTGLGGLIVAFGQVHGVAALSWLIGSQLVMIFGVPIYNINQLSLRQVITPPGVRGRVNATNRCLVWGTMPIGSLLGGLLGQAIGLQPTIAAASIGMLLAGLWIAASPVRTLRSESIAALADLA